VRMFPLITLLLPLAWLGCLVAKANADQDHLPQIEARGPLHEAYAQPFMLNPTANEPVRKEPPLPLREEPPELGPTGDRIQWMPGYWQYEDDKQDFVWISGFWRDTPTNRRWVPGFWAQSEAGNRWVSGHWAADQERDYQFVPPPPMNMDTGPTHPAPDPNCFYIPGCWFYTENGYTYRTGYWSEIRPGYVWAPAKYEWTPAGWIFSSGYWDYAISNRGVAMAPAYFPVRAANDPNYVYKPEVAVNPAAASGNLFVSPTTNHYYFGNYYAAENQKAGIQPWAEYSVKMYDPIFAYERWANKGNADWLKGLQALVEAQRSGKLPALPMTWDAQNKEAGQANGAPILSTLQQLRIARKIVKFSPEQRQAQAQKVQALLELVQKLSQQAANSQAQVPTSPDKAKQEDRDAKTANYTPPAKVDAPPAFDLKSLLPKGNGNRPILNGIGNIIQKGANGPLQNLMPKGSNPAPSNTTPPANSNPPSELKKPTNPYGD